MSENLDVSITRSTDTVIDKLARLIVPILLTVIGTMLWFWLSSLSVKLDSHSNALATINSDIRDINTRMNGELIVQLHDQSETIKLNKEDRDAQFARVNARLEVLENQRSVK